MSRIFWVLKHPFPTNLRQRNIFTIVIAGCFLLTVFLCGLLLSDDRIVTNLDIRNHPPSLVHLFGTDWLGRDMLIRTLKGVTLSSGVGLIGALISVCIAVIFGLLAGTMGKFVDSLISWLIDLFLSVPHLVMLILISFALGGGMQGIILALGITHWPSLARVIRAEVMQIRSADYVQISYRLGKSRFFIAVKHIFPQIVPQVLVGFFLLFPHVILHEAAVTFLGMGLSPHEPAIGIILSESMRYLSTGMWWLAFFPGLFLLIIVRTFDIIGDHLRTMVDPHRAHE